MVLLKRFFILATAIHITLAVKPPNYIEKPKVPDKYPPKYEYNYYIANRKTQSSQGHKETRNGDFTRGNYFVNLPKGESKTTVNYIADEWGFHPVTRYASRGPHHSWSGHFALGLHAVERLNETNLNTNEVFINQLSDYQHAAPPQQQAQATFPNAQVVYNPNALPIQMPLIDNKPPMSNIYAPNQPNHDRQQQFVFQSPGALYSNQHIPLLRNQEKHSNPAALFQHAQQMPLIYQYAQQHAPQQNNYYYQQKPQEAIYHQEPIASMASLQEHQQQYIPQQQQQQQQQFVVDESQQFAPSASPETVSSNDGNINVDFAQATAQEIHSQEEILPQPLGDSVNGNLIQVQPEAPNNVASDNQKQAKLEKEITSIEEQSQEAQFQSPIVVDEQQIADYVREGENQEVVVQQKPQHGHIQSLNYHQPQQVNIQILTDAQNSNNEDQYSKEDSVTPKIVNGHTNSNNYQYLVEDDQALIDSTPSPQTSEAPSRQFLKKFKNFRNYHEPSTSVSQSYSTSTTRTVSSSSSEGGCCNDNVKTDCCQSQVLEITQRPISTSVLAPVHAGVLLTNEKLDDCVDGHSVTPSIVEVQNSVGIKNVLVQEQPHRVPIYGDKVSVSSTPAPIPVHHHLIHSAIVQPTYKQEKKVGRPIVQFHAAVEKQHHTEVIHQPIFIEKPVIKEVQVPVEKPVYIQTPPQFIDRQVFIKTPPQTQIVEKVVHEPVEVEKVVEKIVDRPYYINTPPKFIDRPVYVNSPPQTQIVEKIVHEPVEVEKVVEKIVDRPYYIQSPPETTFIEKQVIVEKPVIKEVQVPVEKTVYVQSPPETKIVHQPVIQTVEKPVYIEKIVQQPYEVEKIVEKFIDRPVIQTVEKPVYIEKFIDRPVEKIVEKPVIQTVERFVDRPVVIEKFIDRPYHVPYPVGVPFEKHVFHKPDFHVIAKSNHHKHKIFDFEGLFGFLGKRKEIKHIYVPSSHQHQLKQLNHHQLIASTYTTIDPVQEAPILDYSRYATTHLNPIKPVYGVPSGPVASAGYSYPNPYAGNYAYDQGNTGGHGVATIPSSWLNDNQESQSQAVYSQASVPRDNYVGPTPLSDDYWAVNGVSTKEGIKFRRNVENGRSFRIEYGGFLPKMEPSIEIDENGKPLKKEK